MGDSIPSIEELRKIEAAILVQENLREKQPNDLIEITLAALHARWEKILIAMQGSGAIAAGNGTKALGQAAILIEGDVGGDFLEHGAQKIEKHHHSPESTEEDALHKAYLKRVFENPGYLSLAGVDPKPSAKLKPDRKGTLAPLALSYYAFIGKRRILLGNLARVWPG